MVLGTHEVKTFLLLATALNTILAQQNKAECVAMRYTDEQLEAVGDEGCAQAAAQLEAVWLPSCGDSPFLLVDTCDDYIDAMVQMCAVLCPVDKCESASMGWLVRRPPAVEKKLQRRARLC